MLRRLILLVVLGLTAVGCDKSTPYKDVFREQLAVQKELIRVLRTVQDEGGMAAARADLEKYSFQAQEVARRAKELPPPSLEVRGRLEEELPALQESMLQLKEEMKRIMGLPGGEKFLRQLDKTRSEP